MTLQEMAIEATGSSSGNGLQCPKCGWWHLEPYKTIQRSTRIERYEKCRNPNCGAKWITKQGPKEIVREVDSK